MALVPPVEVDDHRRRALERTRARERSGVERAPRYDLAGELERELFRIVVVAADERIAVCFAVRKRRGGERVQPGGDGPPEEQLRALGDRRRLSSGEDALLREAQLA